MPAYLARPPKCAPDALPAVLFNHSHGGGYTIGKKEFVEGRSYLQPEPYAKALTDLGYVGLCIDHWVFGERSHTTELDMFKAMLWEGQVLWGMMVYDSLRALDWLVDAAGRRPARASPRSACRWAARWRGGSAALDERVKVTVDICCLTDFQALVAKKGLAGHGVYYYVPGAAEALHDVADQRAHRAARAPRPRGPAGQADAGRRSRHHRSRSAARVYARARPSGALEAPALRRRAPGNARRTSGDHRVPETVAVIA